ncbi:GNAT family N-acetyltransferase [Saxibacter everestensis]|uniref:GNAT family N-acetyltransferase n=1 Tax=Saxibacter everestensis TaxID=2909229 RepID=A0ABY8QVG5_9MICO|nr:GNAT family N-acetyltransferase [Brevibacteriaceae bacterium ZFBP1038]
MTNLEQQTADASFGNVAGENSAEQAAGSPAKPAAGNPAQGLASEQQVTRPVNLPGYELRTFRAARDDEAAGAQTAAWMAATSQGFHMNEPTDEQLKQRVALVIEDNRALIGAYQLETPDGALGMDHPVATYSTFNNPINIGFGQSVNGHLITSVTVRPTHRRKGLLRTLISNDLAGAKEAGFPIAALTVSEASIYRRFGFGPATWSRTISVDTTGGLSFLRPSTGRVELTKPAALRELAPKIFAKFHAETPGSVGRQAFYRELAAGTISEDSAEPDRGARAALHYDENGEIDGYVRYKFAGWDTDPTTVKVSDLVAANGEARQGLWQFLGSIDLVNRVTYEEAAIDDPLPWMLTDSRRVNTTHTEDVLWLRILDPIAALQTRRYADDGTLTIALQDRLGFADGSYRISVTDGVATVDSLAGAETAHPDLSMDVSALASIYLGGADPVVLAAGGQIDVHSAGSAERARKLFALDRAAYCITHF